MLPQTFLLNNGRGPGVRVYRTGRTTHLPLYSARYLHTFIYKRILRLLCTSLSDNVFFLNHIQGSIILSISFNTHSFRPIRRPRVGGNERSA